MNTVNIAIVGATGMVGRKFIEVLEESSINIKHLYLYSSSRSSGTIISYNNNGIIVEELTEDNIKNKQIDYALFSAGGSVSLAYAKVFTKYGAIVIDNSSAWRMDDSVPLIVPEVNMEDAFNHNGIIANPNCSTIQSVLPLEVLKKEYGLHSVSYATYQAVSGSGVNGVTDLKNTTKGKAPICYPYKIYNNCIPHIDEFLDNGYTKEEIKMIFETRKILNDPSLEVTATCVRVPVINSHSVEMHIELDNEFSIEDIKQLMKNKKGITLLDDPSKNIYPLATIATGTNDVYVGRIRKDINNSKKLHLFCVADNIRKGAATNAVQIVEALIERNEYNG